LNDRQEDGRAAWSANRREIDLWSLVLSAVGMEHRVRPDAGGWIIAVPAEAVERAQQEIAAYEAENVAWPPAPTPPDPAVHRPPTIILLGALLIFHSFTGPWNAQNKWFVRGAVDAGRVLNEGEWWRVVTALTLHSEAGHLAGNILIGGIIIHLLWRQIGTGVGLFSVIAAGALGNSLNVIVRGTEHLSVGFSSAVFAAVGLLAMQEIIRLHRISVRSMALPLAAALGLLGFIGTEGEHTDLGAHFFGLGSGLAIGCIVPAAQAWARGCRFPVQQALALLTLLSILICWLLALNASEFSSITEFKIF